MVSFTSCPCLPSLRAATCATSMQTRIQTSLPVDLQIVPASVPRSVIPETTLWRLEKSGDLPALRIGRRRFYRLSDWQAFLNRAAKAPPCRCRGRNRSLRRNPRRVFRTMMQTSSDSEATCTAPVGLELFTAADTGEEIGCSPTSVKRISAAGLIAWASPPKARPANSQHGIFTCAAASR